MVENSGSYSYLNMDLRNKPGSLDATTVASDEGSSPRHQLGFQSFLDLPGHLEFSQMFRYVGILTAQQTPVMKPRISACVASHSALEFSVTGQNLLQPHHPEYGGDPGPLVGIKRNVLRQLRGENELRPQLPILLPGRIAPCGESTASGRLGRLRVGLLRGSTRVACWLAVLPVAAQDPKPTEYQVKAAYLSNLGRFVETWGLAPNRLPTTPSTSVSRGGSIRTQSGRRRKGRANRWAPWR